jgi:flagellin-like protein
MKMTARKAVDPIIATLLLIAIAVAAGIIVYVFVNSLSGGLTQGGGQQVSQQLQLQAYTFTGVSGTTVSSSGVIADISLQNTGSSSLTISSIYFDGTALTELGVAGGPYSQYFEPATAANANCFAAIPNGVALTAYTGGAQTTSGAVGACTTNASQSNCGTVTCFQTAAGAQTETLTLAAQGTNQLIITLASAATPGTSHTVKIVTANGGQAVFTIVAGRTG